MRFQIKLEQLEESFGIQQRNRQAQSALKNLPTFTFAIRLPSLHSAWTGGDARPHMAGGGLSDFFCIASVLQLQTQLQLLCG